MVRNTAKVMDSHSFTLIRTEHFSDPNKLQVHTRCQWRISHYGSRVIKPLSAFECINAKTPDIHDYAREALISLSALPGVEHLLVLRWSIVILKGGAFNWHSFDGDREDPSLLKLILDIVKDVESKYK